MSPNSKLLCYLSTHFLSHLVDQDLYVYGRSTLNVVELPINIYYTSWHLLEHIFF